MTGEKVFERALVLLNYTDPAGNVSRRQNAEIFKRAVPVINAVLADVQHVSGGKFVQIEDIDADLPVSDDVAMRVMPYGVAMHIAQSENDGDNQQLMAQMYNSLRGSIPRASGQRVNVLPTVWG